MVFCHPAHIANDQSASPLRQHARPFLPAWNPQAAYTLTDVDKAATLVIINRGRNFRIGWGF